MRILVPLAALFAMLGGSPRAEAQSCVGDCSGNGAVTIDELISGVSIALGGPPVSTCSALDANGDFEVTIDELVRAVSAALEGCHAVATVTPTEGVPIVTVTPLPSETDTALPTDTAGPPDTPTPTPTETVMPTPPTGFCSLPGSVLFTAAGVGQVPGGPGDAPNLDYLKLPVGFCAKWYGRVRNVRQLRFAPGGELFAASPTKFTTGNGQGGRNAIVALPDDNADGTADEVLTFLGDLSATQGLLFHDGYLYFQDDTKIMRVPYAPGDRSTTAAREPMANIMVYASLLHWPKTLDVADDGTIYVTNGGDEGEPCNPNNRPFHGGILKLDSAIEAVQVAKGFRNPISVRCARGYGRCFAIELARDYTTQLGGREKLVPVRDGDDWGYPCCATKNTPYQDLVENPAPDCTGVAQEIDSFFIGHTPFDLDYELGKWPEPWTHRAFVPLHGIYGSWKGARLVGIDFDVMTGMVLPGSDLSGKSEGAMADFATGWDDGTKSHGRPANIAFAPDGRLFLGNDNTGHIIWIAPFGL
jgi:glucose/arabinose dehydrogenase